MKFKHRHQNLIGKILSFFIIFILIDIVACTNKVIKPDIDSTPPEVQWDILHPDTKEHQLISESEYTQEVDKDKIYFTTCKGRDPQGLKYMKLSIRANLHCQKLEGNMIYEKSYILNNFQEVSYTPDSENKVPTSGFISRNLNGSEWIGISCNYGYHSTSVIAYMLECEAKNWLDTTTTSSLTVINE